MLYRGKDNSRKRDEEDANCHLIDEPVKTCYLEFDENYELNFNYGNN